MDVSEPKKKTAASAADQTLEWTLLKTKKVIGFWVVNLTTLFRQVSLQITDQYNQWGENQIYTGIITNDSGLSVIFSEPTNPNYVRLYIEDCESGDELIGRLFYQ